MDRRYGQLIEPPPQAFGFGAPGWYVLAALLLLVILWLGWLILRRYSGDAYRRRALKAITDLQWRCGSSAGPANGASLVYEAGPVYNTELVYGVNMLIKRIAMSVYGREAAAGLRTTEWIAFLNRGWRVALFGPADSMLLEGLYGNGTDQGIDGTDRLVDEFVARAKEWIKKHRPIKKT
jgi:hypothetical protein